MIVVKSPLRVSLGGGGTDLPSYYLENEGFVVAAAINKYVYVTVSKPFTNNIILKYSENEIATDISSIRHPIIREVLRMNISSDEGIEISSIADLPSGTGLGSSGSFTTGLIKAIKEFKKVDLNREELAELACKVELDILREPIGKQDQYIAAFGGFRTFTFLRDGKVNVKPLEISDLGIRKLNENLLLFYTGFSRSASLILKDQDSKSKAHNIDMIKNLDFIKKIGYESMGALENNRLEDFGELMNVHWEFKKSRSTEISNSFIDEVYSQAVSNGAIGGKLVGAGGGGFLMFYAKDADKLRNQMGKMNLREVEFSFDYQGTSVALN